MASKCLGISEMQLYVKGSSRSAAPTISAAAAAATPPSGCKAGASSMAQPAYVCVNHTTVYVWASHLSQQCLQNKRCIFCLKGTFSYCWHVCTFGCFGYSHFQPSRMNPNYLNANMHTSASEELIGKHLLWQYPVDEMSAVLTDQQQNGIRLMCRILPEQMFATTSSREYVCQAIVCESSPVKQQVSP